MHKLTTLISSALLSTNLLALNQNCWDGTFAYNVNTIKEMHDGYYIGYKSSYGDGE